MKQRTGFVSNSSSSSFVVFGTEVDAEEIENLFEGEDSWDIEQTISKMISGPVSVLYDSEGSGDYYIGLDPAEIDDDMTMGEAKANMKAAIEKVLGREVKMGWIDEVIYG